MSVATPTARRLEPARSSWTQLRDHHWAPLPVLLAGTFMIILDFSS
jgi:hypothetical protein